MTTEFSSEGFDLDAISGSEDVVLEAGGGVTRVESENKSSERGLGAGDANEEDVSPIAESEDFKSQGNTHFKQGAYLEAHDMYTEAIQACPGMKGETLLKEKADFEEKQHSLAMEQQRKFDEERRANPDEDPERPPPMDSYKPPMHIYGDKLAVYYSNRAAVCLHLSRFDDAIKDCDVAVILNPSYTKAWMRRSNAYEKTDRIEEALGDAKVAQGLDPNNTTIRANVKRLQKLEDERLEKLKEETMGKLKDLGNSLLGNFGLSLDNFNATQGKDGNYSISFNQGAKADV